MSARSRRPPSSVVPAVGLAGYEMPEGAVLLAFDVGRKPAEPASAALAALTPGQRQVVAEAVEGRHDAEIAQRLGLSRHTVSNHLRRAYARLGVGTRIELCALLRGGPPATAPGRDGPSDE